METACIPSVRSTLLGESMTVKEAMDLGHKGFYVPRLAYESSYAAVFQQVSHKSRG